MKKESIGVVGLILIVVSITLTVISGVINTSSKSNNQRSIELYGSSIKNAIKDYSMKNNGDIPSTYQDLNDYLVSIGKTIKDYYEGNVTCNQTIINSDGSVYLSECIVDDILVSNFDYGDKLGI